MKAKDYEQNSKARDLNDKAGMFITEDLTQRQRELLSDHAKKGLGDEGFLRGGFLLTNTITAEQYLIGANIRDNEDGTMDSKPMILEYKNNSVVERDVNDLATKKLGIDVSELPYYRNESTSDRRGHDNGVINKAEWLMGQENIAKLIDQGIERDSQNQIQLAGAPLDTRSILRAQVSAWGAIKNEREAVVSDLDNFKVFGAEAMQRIYQSNFEPHAYSLDRDNNLINSIDSRRLQTAAYSSLDAGEFMNLNDFNQEYVVGKPAQAIDELLGNRAVKGLEYHYEKTYLGGTSIKRKGDDNTTVIYGVEGIGGGTGTFDAVTFNPDNEIVATGKQAGLAVGINLKQLNQGQDWLKFSNHEEEHDFNIGKIGFMSQINADNVRRIISESQIIEFKKELGESVEINNLSPKIQQQANLSEADREQLLNFGPRSSFAKDKIAQAVFKATFTDRFTLSTIEGADELGALSEIIGLAESVKTKPSLKDQGNKQVFRAIKMQEHWSDNSSDIATPGKVDKVRIITQATNGDLNTKELPTTQIFEFTDGEFSGSYLPHHDSELSMQIDRAIYEKAEGCRIDHDSIFQAALESDNNKVRNDIGFINKYDNKSDEKYKELDAYLSKVDTASRKPQSKPEAEKNVAKKPEEARHKSAMHPF